MAMVAVTVLATSTVFANHQFEDVPNSNPFHDDIAWASNAGIAEGFPDGTYRPGQPVTRQAMAAFLHRTYDALYPQQLSRPFHLFVHCPATTRYAVVAANGTLARGSAGTTTAFLSTGTYEVIFNTNVANCAYQATVGATATGSAEGWATVASRGENVNGVFVATFDIPG